MTRNWIGELTKHPSWRCLVVWKMLCYFWLTGFQRKRFQLLLLNTHATFVYSLNLRVYATIHSQKQSNHGPFHRKNDKKNGWRRPWLHWFFESRWMHIAPSCVTIFFISFPFLIINICPDNKFSKLIRNPFIPSCSNCQWQLPHALCQDTSLEPHGNTKSEEKPILIREYLEKRDEPVDLEKTISFLYDICFVYCVHITFSILWVLA